jgi:hypothetical protein
MSKTNYLQTVKSDLQRTAGPPSLEDQVCAAKQRCRKFLESGLLYAHDSQRRPYTTSPQR